MGRQCVESGGRMRQQFYTMKELPVSERPYEKAKKQGNEALSDAELLAVLLKTGTHEKNSVELAREVLDLHPVHTGLLGLYYLSDEQLKKIRGIGEVKAIQLQCVAELSKRLARERKPEREKFDSPQCIAQYFMEEMRALETEQTTVLYLDNRCRLIHRESLFSGSVASCVLHPREVLKKGLQYDASCFVLIHNHPSGDPTPSQADLDATIRMKRAGEMIGISLLDHLILGDYQYVSLKERGHI